MFKDEDTFTKIDDESSLGSNEGTIKTPQEDENNNSDIIITRKRRNGFSFHRNESKKTNQYVQQLNKNAHIELCPMIQVLHKLEL